MLTRREILSAGAAVALAPWTPALAQVPSASPYLKGSDLLILNGRVVTMDPARPEAEAVLVKAGRIAFVGAAADAKAMGRGVKTYDARGRAVFPGFIDGHCHIEAFSESFEFQSELPGSLKSLQDMFAILKRATDTTRPGRWVIGRALANVQNQVSEKRLPTREELDAVSTERPVVLFTSPHVCAMNTVAFKMLGVWTPEDEKNLKWSDGTPIRGIFVHRDGNGVPTGIATEVQEVIWSLQPYTQAERVAAYSKRAKGDYVSKGLTSMTLISGAEPRVSAITQAHREGKMPVRTRRFSLVPQAIGFDAVVKRDGPRDSGDDMMRFGGVKIFIDGAGTDGMGQSYNDFKWSLTDLSDMVTRCAVAGYPTIMHAITEPGMRLAFAAHAEAQRRSPNRLRHRIDHLPFLNAEADVAQLKKLGLGVGLTRAQRGDGRPLRQDYQALLRAGVPVQAVSDSAGSFADFSPMAGIASLVAPLSEGGALADGKTLTLDEALKTYTTTAAWAMYEENDKGSITAGKLADFVILSKDPRTLKGGALFDVQVDEVILSGQSVHKRA